MLDHASFAVKDYQKSLAFYDQTLGILGYARILTFDLPEGKIAEYGSKESTNPFFSISSFGNDKEEIGNARGVHIAFLAPTIETIHAWYNKCLALGAKDNGKPGLRPEYHAGYYGAFVIDPNGWRIEACLNNYKA